MADTEPATHAEHRAPRRVLAWRCSASLPGIGKKMLTQTVREMERDGLLSRQVFGRMPPRVDTG